MRTDEERIAILHKRAEKLEAQKKMCLWGSASGALLILLLAVIVKIDVPLQSILDGSMAGSSLLGESAGGYVLVAVVAFFAGVVITTVLRRRQERDADNGHGGAGA